jgi:organic hydroperoxide reductase OsmC/OhrA
MSNHDFAITLRWDGNTGRGTEAYASYERTFRARAPGKPTLVGSAHPTFRGDASRYNPEDLLVMSLSSCHMLAYLALCARGGVDVVAYSDDATGRMVTADGGGHFERVVLRPRVAVAAGDPALARALHDQAHARCFIASSVNFDVVVEPTVEHVDHAPAPAAPRQDLAVRVPDRPGALADVAERLGRAGISLEGGGGFAVGADAIVRFLVADAGRAAAVLRDAGIEVVGVRDVLVQRLDQDAPGQLGGLARAMADAGVNIECVYSDHDHQLVVVVDDAVAGARVSAAWDRRPRAGAG